jgi:nucleoside-diphosphate-sugar epimerase
MAHTLLITGAAGYVGAMLAEQFAKRPDVEKIVALDKEERPATLANSKIVWITANTADSGWQEQAARHKPDIVIHTAWQIREFYGNRALGWKWNVEGTRAVFDFAFETPTVERLVHFSTAAVYGAYATNSLAHYFKEDEPLREEEYSYAVEKIQAERDLEERAKKQDRVSVAIVRPAAITGPRGRFGRIRFGLQSALMGQLTGNIFYRIISAMVSFVPATPWWVRQFVHEDDVCDIVALLAFEKPKSKYDVVNLAPPGEPVLAPQMAHSVGKGVLPVRPFMVRAAFFVFWHLSRGKIPNGRGVWRFYSYPVVMDGTKLTREYGYRYSRSSYDAFYYTNGRYEEVVPEASRRSKS